MPFVLDASVILAWAFEEQFADAEITLERVRSDTAGRSGDLVVRGPERAGPRGSAAGGAAQQQNGQLPPPLSQPVR